jgi:hypothetical protein
LFWCGVKSKRIGFFHIPHSSIYRVNVLIFDGKAVVERRGFRPKIFDEICNPIEFDPVLWELTPKSLATGQI